MSGMKNKFAQKSHVVFRQYKKILLCGKMSVSWVCKGKDSDEEIWK